VAECTANPAFHFDSVAGHHIVLCFFGSAAHPPSREALTGFVRLRAAFDDENACFFGVSNDPQDRALARVQESLPGLRFFWDFDKAVARLYGAAQEGQDTVRLHTLVLDPLLRVVAAFPLDGTTGHAESVVEFLATQPRFAPSAPAQPQAPVLLVPRVFEPELCRALMACYDEGGGEESGFMRQVDGRTVHASDPSFKRRRDQEVTDEALRKACVHRIHDRLVPEVHKAFQFRATRIERHIVACYDAASSGFFSPHRDNTTKGTAHRRFAVSLNLNTGEYEGGCLSFPEFGRQLYVPPAGGAIVFSCSLLHEATPVTAGKRYAFLPFLYDEEAARLRQENLAFLGEGPPVSGRDVV
jgi:peroxiredoxin/predicted 2-oxoglutarate/Fe(II)-dependent dioxygenase YbiX